MTVPRPLPSAPSLEYVRKEAKALLKQLRARDAEATHRLRMMQAPHAPSNTGEYQLADAQLTLAREYGFISWPRLVRYVTTAERQRHREHSALATPSAYEQWAKHLLAEHRKRRVRAGKILAEYTPRFFGVSLQEVFRATVTEDEARHALARDIGCTSWSALIAKATEAVEERNDGWDLDVPQLAIQALRRGDLTALQEVTRAHPELLRPSARETAQNGGILNFALGAEMRLGVEALRPIMDWLATHGLDAVTRRSAQLCGSSFMNAADVRSLLDRGANPNWIAPNGLSVLEHALLRYQQGECVDLIARHTLPPRALWIAAGLGDVAGVASFFDASGALTAAARARRPDFTAVGPLSWPSHADADDEAILFETAYVAASNGRVDVLEYLISRGLPVNSLVWDCPLLGIAAERGWRSIVACLMVHGADPDLGSRSSGMQTVREVSHLILSRLPWDARVREIALCIGIDADAVLAERERRSAPTLATSTELQRMLLLASDDAKTHGAEEIVLEHLFFGMLRAGGPTQFMLARGTGIDFNMFRNAVVSRVRVAEPDPNAVVLPLASEVTTVIDAAVSLAVSRHDEAAHGMHLIAVLAAQGSATIDAFLAPCGGSLAATRDPLASIMQYDNAT